MTAPDPITLREQHRTALDEDEADRLEAMEQESAQGRVGLGAAGSCSTVSTAVDEGQTALDSSKGRVPAVSPTAAGTPTLPEQIAADVDYMSGVLDRMTAVGEHALRMDLYRVIYGIERRVLGR